MRLALLASGEGSNAVHLISLLQKNPSWPIEISVVISDKEDAPVLEKARSLNVLTYAVPFIKERGKHLHERDIFFLLEKHQVDWVFLCGYMRILSPLFLEKFVHPEGGYFRVVNIHPSLLPLFKGKDAYKEAFLAHVPYSGITIHLVDEGMDSGPILLQQSFPRLADDTLESFIKRGKSVEHQLYGEALRLLALDQLC